MYDGRWTVRHINRDNYSKGLLNDFVTAVEYDHAGNLWIGYGEGIQIYNGIDYRIIRDQQLLKDRRIKALQRWDDGMWVATGNSGIHRYLNESWTWFQPGSPHGPEFSEADSMAIDPKDNALLIATKNEGIFMVPSQQDPVIFACIAKPESEYGQMEHVRKDPLGGAYFFNKLEVTHYSNNTGWVRVLAAQDLTQEHIDINDVAASPDGRLFVATDDGIYTWQDGMVVLHMGRFEGIGTSRVVQTLFFDAADRLWFATPGFIGYYYNRSEIALPVTIKIVTAQSTVQPTPAATLFAPETPASNDSSAARPAVTVREPSLLERIHAFFSEILNSLKR
jgi:ligand-binding sensor domain-containing protein